MACGSWGFCGEFIAGKRGEEGRRGLSAVGSRVGGDGPLGPREPLNERGNWWTGRVVAKENSLCSIWNYPSNFVWPSNYMHDDTSS